MDLTGALGTRRADQGLFKFRAEHVEARGERLATTRRCATPSAG